MKRALALWLLLSGAALAQQGVGPSNGGLTRGNFLRIPDYRTPGTGAQSYFVDGATGSDTFTCQSASTPCLTIQGALNKIPKLLRDGTTVTVAAGNYAGFYIAGFRYDPGVQQSTGGLTIQGTYVNSTLAGGSVTGSATGGTQGTLPTFGTMTTAAAGWTVNDLRGRFVSITGGTGSGQRRVISSNTATDLTIVGRWTTTPTGTSTFAIQDDATIINSAVAFPPTGTESAVPGLVGAYITDNQLDYQSGGISLIGLKFSGIFESVYITDNASAVSLRYMQITGSANPVFIGALSFSDFIAGGNGPSYLNVYDCYVLGTGGSDIIASSPSRSGFLTIQRSLFNFVNYIVHSAGPTVQMIASEGILCDDICVVAPAMLVSGSRMNCTAAGTRIAFANDVSVFNASQTIAGDLSTIATTNVTGCHTAVDAIGTGTNYYVTSLTGAAGTTGLSARLGGQIQYTAATTLTAGTNEINVESGGATAAFSDLSSGQCLTDAPTGSRVCKQ